MNWWVFCYWYEPDAPEDPVGLVRIWTMAQELVRSGDSVSVFAPDYRSVRIPRLFRTVPIPLINRSLLRPLSYAIRSFIAALVTLRQAKPDIVYYRWMDSLHPLLLARLLRCRCVCEVNGEPVPDWQSGQRRMTIRLRHWLARYALRRCDAVVVLTEGLRTLVTDRYEVDPVRVTVLPSGTDTKLFTPCDRDACRREADLDPKAEYVGFVGSFYQYQGLASLLDAFAMIASERPSARLLLVGDGETVQALHAQAERLGISGAIIWTGRCPYEQVPTFIGAMDVCVAPFRADRGETSPVKLFDYLACARPVVASAIPAVKRLCSPEQGVVLVAPDNPPELAKSILALLADKDQALLMGQRGRRFVEERFSWAQLTASLKRWIRSDHVLIAHAHPHLLR